MFADVNGYKPSAARSIAEAKARIAECGQLNAFISLTEEGEGIPVAIKDLIRVRGTLTTGGGAALPRFPDYDDASLVVSLRDAGCAVVGKTNMSEWGLGVFGQNPYYGSARNPADEARAAGGSSSGSAVAVAAGLCAWAVGTDTGGSIRIPASLCGVVGLKPTTGLVSLDGVLPLSASLDCAGPLGKDVATVATALEAMTGRQFRAAGDDSAEPRLCTPDGWATDLAPDVSKLWGRVRRYASGISIPAPRVFAAVHQTIMLYEAARTHARGLQLSPGAYGEVVRSRLVSGTMVGDSEYQAALVERCRLRDEVTRAINDFEALILPTTPGVAPLLGGADDPSYARFTRPFSLTGHPALSLPLPGMTLPVGVQLVGHFDADASLLALARRVERLVGEWCAP